MSLLWKDSLTQSSGSNADSFRHGGPLAQVSNCLSIVETHSIIRYSTSNSRISKRKHCSPQSHNLKPVFSFFFKNKSKKDCATKSRRLKNWSISPHLSHYSLLIWHIAACQVPSTQMQTLQVDVRHFSVHSVILFTPMSLAMVQYLKQLVPAIW